MGIKIGSGFTNTTEDGKTFISISLFNVLGVIFPFLKPIVERCFITLWFIPQENRKNEKSPAWDLVIDEKKEKKEPPKVDEEIPF